MLPAAVIVRTSVGRAFVPKPLRLLLVRLLPGDDRAEVVHEGLGVGRALDASQQFAPGVEHEVEGMAPLPYFFISSRPVALSVSYLAATNRWSMNSPTSLREKTCLSIIRHGGHQLA